jgi:hypothetical protein
LTSGRAKALNAEGAEEAEGRSVGIKAFSEQQFPREFEPSGGNNSPQRHRDTEKTSNLDRSAWGIRGFIEAAVSPLFHRNLGL